MPKVFRGTGGIARGPKKKRGGTNEKKKQTLFGPQMSNWDT